MLASEIRIIPKPNDISYKDIQELYARAHDSNRRKGIIHGTTSEPIDKFEARFKGEKCMCFVAMDGDKIVGTTSVDVQYINRWYAKGRVAHSFFWAVDPEYKGQHIATKLNAVRDEYIKQIGVDRVTYNTAEHNTIVKAISRKEGFKKVDFCAYRNNNCYSIVYMKWLKGCPFSSIYIELRFLYNEMRVRLKYKPGRIKRFSKGDRYQ